MSEVIRYEYVEAGDHPQHGWIYAYEGTTFLGKTEQWSRLSEMGGEWTLQHMAAQANASIPGNRIPSGDPRFYTHCQWCGDVVDFEAGQRAAWFHGQWHSSECYKHRQEAQS